jgi:glutamate carboxypeptidase
VTGPPPPPTPPDRDLLLADVERLVAIESPSSDVPATAGCLAAAATLLEERTGHPPVIVTRDGRPHLLWQRGTPRVLLLGHVDTVWPLGTLARWPFAVSADGATATGPGVFDMKAGVVMGVHALVAAGLPVGAAMLLTTDEELGSPTSRALIEEVAASVEAVLVLEPAAPGGALKTARKGVGLYTLTITGRAAHAGLEPEQGRNALVALAHATLAVADLGRPDRGTTVTPTVASAGTTTNTVPATARLDVDVRAATAAEQDRVDAAIRGLAPAIPDIHLEVRGGINRPPLTPAASADLLARAQRVTADLGQPPLTTAAVGGGSDGNLTAALGIPTLDGCGAVGGGAHAEGEHVDVAPLAPRVQLLAGLLTDLLDG